MEKEYFEKLVVTLLILSLFVLSIMILKPIAMTIVLSLILAYIFSPIYNLLFKLTKSKNLSALLPCIILIGIIVIPIIYLLPIALDQSIKVYEVLKQIDFVSLFEKIFPSITNSDTFSKEIGAVINTFLVKSLSKLSNSLTDIVLNFPSFFLKSFVMLITLFYTLREKDSLIKYIKSVLPFSEDVSVKFIKYSKEMTSSVLFGQVIIGIIQGMIVGIGLFLFKVQNAFLLTIFALIAGIFPIIGPAIVWIPVVIYLFIAGNISAGLGLTIFGSIASSIDNLIRPFLISKKIKMRTPVILISMIGGFFYLGILGFILGPLIVGYLLIIIEFYGLELKNKESKKS